MHIHRTNPGAILLRKSRREGGRIRKITLANLSKLGARQLSRLEFVIRIKRKYRGTRWEELADRHIWSLLIENGLPAWQATCAVSGRVMRAVSPKRTRKGA